MPEVSRFFGMVITMNHAEHPPPHFHVRYGGQMAAIDLVELRLVAGRLSPRAFGLVMEWAALHQVELIANWELAQRHQPLHKIAPLE